jgi:hypothetical protein
MSQPKNFRKPSRSQRSSPRRHRRRRAVILLVVLGMLALFTVVVLTFVIVARQHQQASVAQAKGKQYDDAYEEHLNQAALQILRGTNNGMSVLGPHSLLEDLYGSGLNSEIAGTSAQLPNGGFLAGAMNVEFAMGATGRGGMMYIKLAQAQMKPPVGLSATGVFESIPGYYVGRILTMTSGAAKGKSARITGYAPVPLDKGPDGNWGINNFDDDNNGTTDDISEQGWPGSDDPWQIRLMPFEGMTQDAAGGWTGDTPAAGDEFVINGRTFAGTGFGYDPDTFTQFQLLNATSRGPDGQPGVAGVDDDPDGPGPLTPNGTTDDIVELNAPGSDDSEFALTPNPTRPDYQNYLANFPINANEDYDAADYQNMLLAMRIADASGVNSVPIPSLHRPELVLFWANRPISSATKPWNHPTNGPELKRKVILRPLPSDHAFTNVPLHATTNPGGTSAYEFREPFVDLNNNGSIEPGEFTDLDGDGAWDAGDLDFTGKPFNPIEGPWDVDNDGDGVPDSIWVDIGLPVETLPDGRIYKPLAAIMVLDMDGKLNLNFHGQLNDWNNDLANGLPAYSNPDKQLVQSNVPIAPAAKPELAGTWNSGAMPPVTRPAVLAPGLGLGPQEVSLSLAAGTSQVLLTTDEFRNLCRGFVSTSAVDQGRRYEGRYGEAYLLPNGNYNTAHAAILAGISGNATVNGDDNYFSRLLGLNNANYNNQGNYVAYGSPTDFDGNGVLGLTPSGHPQFYAMGKGNGSSNHPEVMDDAAELTAGRDWYITTASGRVKVDAKFTPADLEWLLRQQDVDGPSLRSRLPNLAPGLASRYNASRATTESWSIPSPSFNPTPEIAKGLHDLRLMDIGIPTTNLGIVDLIRGKIREVGQLDTPPKNYSVAAVNTLTRQLLRQDAIAPELLLGLRFNINRPFGNNRDDDGDGIVDEPDEAYIAAWASDGIDNDGDGAVDEADEPYEKLWSGQAMVDRDGDGRVTARDYDGVFNMERQRYAKQLYTLMMLLKDHMYALDNKAGQEEDAARAELTAREIAQWCINVVDFRDQDSIMTPFEYVINPFDAIGWNVDGDIRTNEASSGVNPNRRVVWGCETPTLVLTETLAFHDKRVENLPDDDGTPPEERGMMAMAEDYDSKRIPQGSAFLEVQCVRNPNNDRFGQDLFTVTGEIDLGKMIDGTTYRSPVWRVAISESKSKNSGASDVTNRLSNYPFSSAIETVPHKFNPVVTSNNQGNDVQIERIVWFAPEKPSATHPDLERVYYNRAPAGTNVHLRPGHFAVVGPSRHYSAVPTAGTTTKRNVTRIGTNDNSDMPQEVRMTQLFEITDNNSGDVSSISYPNSYPYPVAQPAATPTIKEVMGIAVGADRNDYDASWDPAKLGPVGFSISEPLFSDVANYYSPPDEESPADKHDGSKVWDRYSMAKDQPLDSKYLLTDRQGGLATGTTDGYKTAFLQRLADPTREYNPPLPDPEHKPNLPLNPYLTVDWLPMDLTVFNGSAPRLAQADPAADPDNNDSHNVKFRSRQRGNPKTPPAMSGSKFSLWSAASEFINVDSTAEAGSDVAHFPFLLDHTLGFLNEPFHDTAATSPWMDTTNPYLNPNTYVGDPQRPFPWLTWNNRPFANAMELLQVPMSSSGRLYWDYSNLDRDPATVGEFYSDPVALMKSGSPYGHLLNFFQSSNQSSDYTTQKPTNSAVKTHNQAMSNYYRVFDFVAVPSPFEGTQTLLNPAAFGPTSFQEKPNWFVDYDEDGTHDPGEPWEFAPFYAPNNWLPTYREPGKVNINTISDAQANTWLGVTGGFNSIDHPSGGPPDDNAMWPNIVASRQGYAGAPLQPSPTMPSVFSNPFRMTGNISYVPIPALRGVNTSGELIDSTLLRRLPNMTGHVNPLLAFITEQSTPPAYDAPTTEGEFNDANRNPYFKYQSYQKLGNILTTQSNVYAVWVTVGFFEVERVATSTVHPDGYRLMQEIGSDTGEIKRHRAFYIIDRSIPVAFQRGMNHNVHRAILTRRVIE